MINPPYLDKLHALARHGGQPYGRSGAMDERGRPIVPDYRYDPDATEILWQWLHAQPVIQSIRFVPLPSPPESLWGERPWRCEIVVEPDRVLTGEGTMCNGLQSKWLRTAIIAFLGPNYLPLSISPGPDYLPLRLQSMARDCNQRPQDHIICNSTASPFSARPSWR